MNSAVLPAPLLPAGGVLAFPHGRRTQMQLRGLPPHLLERQSATGHAFEDVIEVDVDRQGDTPWDFLLISDIDAAVAASDVVHVRFWARAVLSMTGSARLAVVVEDHRGDQPGKFAELPVTVGTQWECVDLPLVAPRAYPALAWQFSIRLGYAPQRVQIGGVQVTNFGQSLTVDELPRVRATYTGRDAKASWRDEALARIDRLRKGRCILQILSPQGRPVEGARVRATLRRHRFGFGSCVSTTLLADTPDADRYRVQLARLFSCAVVENELKWPAIRGHRYATSDAIVDWLTRHRLPTRGHVLLWPSPQYMPADVVASLTNPRHSSE